MKISIWQQFASNHSNSFTVVGEFISETRATTAAATLREIFRQIAEQRVDPRDDVLLPAEKWYAQQYNIQWGMHLDWVHSGHPTNHVTQIDNTLFVGPMDFSSTSLGAYVVEDLVAKLGASIKKEEAYQDIYILAYVQVLAPDKQRAQRLYDEISSYLVANDKYWQNDDSLENQPASPWVFHCVGKPDVSEETIRAALRHYRVFSAELDKLSGKIRELQISGAAENGSRIQTLEQEWSALSRTFYGSKDKEYAFWFRDAIRGTGPYENEVGENIVRAELDGSTLHIRNLNFGHHLGYGLPALVSWLRARGCRVEFTIESREYDE